MRPALAVLALVTLAACGGAGGGTPRTASPAPGPADPVGAPGHDAWIGVAVANLWAEPDQARALDAPSLASPVDMSAWLASMTVDDRLWLVGRLVTQALYGDRVTVVETGGGWARVVVPGQPTSLDPRGYPGWLPASQLASRPPAGGLGDAVVTRPTAALLPASPAEPNPMEVSYGTRLPVLAADLEWVTVGTPGGGQARLASTDVAVDPAGGPALPTGEELARSAQQFSGVPYLWGGKSGSAWDCSGLTSAVFAAHGVVIPRDADDQAAAGVPVEPGDLLPGDLLFYATGDDRGSIHHVGMYVGDGRMVQAPATGRTVEVVPIDRPGLLSQFWGARRYVGT